MKKDLRMALKGEYFDAIVSGEKPYENRERNDYWKKRIVDREYDTFTITRGYPKSTDLDKIYTMPYKGYVERTIIHEHFGDKPIEVFSIITTPRDMFGKDPR